MKKWNCLLIIKMFTRYREYDMLWGILLIIRWVFWIFQVPIHSNNKENTTFTCPYDTFANKRMPFGFCKAPATFQRCVMAIIFHFIETTMEVFMNNYLSMRLLLMNVWLTFQEFCKDVRNSILYSIRKNATSWWKKA